MPEHARRVLPRDGPSAADRPRIEEALRLRRWALRVFSRPTSPPPDCSVATWRLFLQSERCALPLKNLLGAHGARQGTASDVRDVLGTIATRELQEVLSARAALRHIAALADELALDVVVLKGGVAVADESRAVALADVDVLARPSEAARLVAELDRAGYLRHGGGSDRHLSKRVATDALPIEVHTTVDPDDRAWAGEVWGRLVSLAEMPTLRRLSARDHLWQLLAHVAVQHPFRAGAIRDLVLIRDALLECTGEDLTEVASIIRRHPDARLLGDVLALARGLGEDPAPDDPFQRTAASVYILQLYGRRIPGPPILRADLGSSAFTMMHGPAMYGRWCNKLVWRRTSGPSLARPIAWLEGRAPRLGRAARVVSRMLRIAIAAVPAALLAALATYLTSRASRVMTYDSADSSRARSSDPRPNVSRPEESA